MVWRITSKIWTSGSLSDSLPPPSHSISIRVVVKFSARLTRRCHQCACHSRSISSIPSIPTPLGPFTNMNLLRKLFGRPAVNISGSSIVNVARDSHTSHYYGDMIHNLNTLSMHSSQAGKGLLRHISDFIMTSSRLSLAINLGLYFDGCHLQFPGV